MRLLKGKVSEKIYLDVDAVFKVQSKYSCLPNEAAELIELFYFRAELDAQRGQHCVRFKSQQGDARLILGHR